MPIPNPLCDTLDIKIRVVKKLVIAIQDGLPQLVN